MKVIHLKHVYTIVSQTRSCHRMEEILFMSLWFFTFLTYKPLKQVYVYLPLVGTGKVLLWTWAVRNLKQRSISSLSIEGLLVAWRIWGVQDFTQKKRKKKGTFQRSQKISVSILMLLIIFKYLTACFKLVHPYKMVSLRLLTITEMRTILLKYWAPQKTWTLIMKNTHLLTTAQFKSIRVITLHYKKILSGIRVTVCNNTVLYGSL